MQEDYNETIQQHYKQRNAITRSIGVLYFVVNKVNNFVYVSVVTQHANYKVILKGIDYEIQGISNWCGI